MKNERTSKRIASIASIIMAHAAESCRVDQCHDEARKLILLRDVSFDDVVSLAASALTQAPDKRTRGRKR